MPYSTEDIWRLHREAPMTDVHVHPSLKAYLFNRNLWRHYCSGKTFNPLASRSDFNMLQKGRVGVMWVAHYYPERQLLQDCAILRLARFVVPGTYRKLTKGRQIDRMLEMMDRMEREIQRHPDRAELARSVADITRIRGNGKIAVLHTVEGAHVLEGNIDNLQKLADRDVAMLTLTHFYRNDVASQVNAIPKTFFINKLCKFKFHTGEESALTEFGKEVLQKMGELRMLVDITHCTPQARAAVYAEMSSDRPVIATHIGAHRFNPDVYNLTDDEIQEIARRDGAIGVIFMNYWLDPRDPKQGREIIWKTIEHIQQVTNSWDHIMLGTDFDGFTDPPDDLRDSSRLGKITRLMLERGVTEAEVKKVLGGNAQRVLETGWR